MKFGLLLSTIFLIVISGFTQTPPMPPAPTVLFGTNHIQIKRQPTYTALCPHCRTKFSNLHPLTIATNGCVGTNGGCIVQRTMTFACPNRECLETFTSQNFMFVPESIAVEDLPTGASAADMPRKAMTATTWTTDPNLKLFINYTNFTNASFPPWPMSLAVGSNELNGLVLPVLCGNTAVVRYSTQLGKSYQLQASSDGVTWSGLSMLNGTGSNVFQYESTTHPNRMYRVQEYVQ